MVLIALAFLRVWRPESGRKGLEAAAPVRGSKLEGADVESQNVLLADPLTGVRSRRFFHSTISADADQAARAYFSDSESYSRDHRDLIFYLIDLDQFKVINETFGEKAGDEILVEAARRLSRIVRSSDFLIRWGGEKFLVVCRAAERRNGPILAEKILAALAEKPFSISGGNQVIRTCSIGWAPFPWEPGTDSRTVEEVLKLAERGLSRAKELGRNQAVGMLPLAPAEVKVGVIEAEQSGEACSGTERELISPGPRWV
ncbi:MAG: GGDEF domain-containing protein [Candidatus Acidiferrales bacterium]